MVGRQLAVASRLACPANHGPCATGRVARSLSARDSMHLPERSSVVATLGVAAILGVVAWFFTRTERRDAFAITACVQLYKKAASRTDTIRIDGQIPLQRAKGELNPLTCGALRSSYPVRFVGDSALIVARAMAAIDSIRGVADSLALRVYGFVRDSTGIQVVLTPVRLVRGGGGVVHFRPNGSIADVRLTQ